MLRLLGAILVGGAALFWGMERGRREKEKLSVIEALLHFVSYTEERIILFKMPLARIFSEYSNEVLCSIGFTEMLRCEGAPAAVASLSDILPEEVRLAMEGFAVSLGGSYSEGQEALCRITKSTLKKAADEQRADLPKRVRMYRLLPLLLCASVIILLI